MEVTEKFKNIVSFLVQSVKLEVVVEPTVFAEELISDDPNFTDVAASLKTWDQANKDVVLCKVDFIICIGGDGTILYTASLFKEAIPPMMSFHVGSLGFLTHFVYENHQQDIRRVIEGNVSLTLRHRLQCVFKTDYEVVERDEDECPISPPADPQGSACLFNATPHLITSVGRDPDSVQLVVNELVVDRGPHPYLCNLELYCNGRFMTSVQGDGASSRAAMIGKKQLDLRHGRNGAGTSTSRTRATDRKKLRIVVEGNIASGKSTLLSKLSRINSVEIMVEPVEQWQNLAGGNLIGRMYEDARRWGYLFQSYVLLTMMELHHKEVEAPMSFLERSVYSARYCFVENLHKSGVMDAMEYECYCQWFQQVTRQNPPQLDLIVYLRSSPEVCYKRLQERGRKEEKPVTLEYLQALHDHYEDWLGNEKHHSWHGNTPVLVIDGNEDCKTNKTLYKKHCCNIFSTLGLPESVSA